MSKIKVKDEEAVQLIAERVYKRIESEFESRTPKQWLRSSDVCSMLGISPATLQQIRINGDIPSTHLSSGTWLYPYEGVVRALDARTNWGKGGPRGN
ncbi:helix-turn-helix domain-containing protein [Mangrovibacterium lignilyticum]|uniref:helix-turn-helix domain-containing protein n=1 Tax=Mangrovibacterium lignilyticum TaxID=2668052 RepID=UPI0013D193D2|nr:helix-turn-helix domain-containing protein [Mangrovibacterium lignilyticum]